MLRSKVRVKIFGNMMELKSPIARAHPAANTPAPWLTARHNAAATNALRLSKRTARKRANKALPANRPTMAPSQYTLTSFPARSCVTSNTSDWCRKLIRVLPTETSAPTYRKIAARAEYSPA